jgi:signal transduction histidine kinase
MDAQSAVSAIEDPKRLRALTESQLLDTPAEPAFDRFTYLASQVLNTPLSLITLIDKERQFFKSAVGMPEPWATLRQSEFAYSFCKHIVASGVPMIVENAPDDPRVQGNLAITEIGVKAYAGVPITSPDGMVLGTFCVMDTEPRQWTVQDMMLLRELALSISTEINLRHQIRQRERIEKTMEGLLEKQSEQHAMLDSILQSMADGVVGSDSEGRITVYNHAAQQMLGIGGGGDEWWNHYPTYQADMVTPYDPDDFPLRKAIQGGYVDGEEIFVQHPDFPNGLFTSRSARPIRDADGNITGGVVVIHNITRRKETEEMVRRLNADLAAANADLEAFGHTIAHDLKSPLHIMGSYADLLMDHREALPDEAQDMIQSISRSVERMTGMINSLLLFAKLRNVDEALYPVQMRPVIEAAVERSLMALEARGVALRVGDEFPTVIGYGPWLEEVFANLISNAVKYIGLRTVNPRISIRGIRQGDVVRYEVEDNGLGITAKDQAKLFQMFQRFHEGHSEGTGLGLSIVARIIAKLGGEIGVISAPNSGSTFWFSLPAADRHP